MPNEKNIVKFNMDGIGPFPNKIKFSFDGGNNKDIKLGIYATNGTGKTFISRCFNEYATALNGSGTAYYPKESLVNFGKVSGKFDLDIQIKNGASCKITMPIDNANTPITKHVESDVMRKYFIDSVIPFIRSL